MLKKRTITFDGYRVHISESKEDSKHNIKLSILANKYGPDADQRAMTFKDENLEAQGYKLFAMVNAGLFFTVNGETFTEGIEKAEGILHESDDAGLDNVLGLGLNENMLYVYSQKVLKERADEFYGMITSAFGLVNNGWTDTRGKVQHKAIYNSKSGRTIIGKKSDGTTVTASLAGVTGRSGITGARTVTLAKQLGLRNAVCMDGGGSVFCIIDGVIYINTSRLLKSMFAVYYKVK